MICEYCNSEFDKKHSRWASGRFCSLKCARGFSSKEKRKEINLKVSQKLKGKRFDVNIKFCFGCRKELTDIKIKNRYCSKQCQDDWKARIAKTKNYRFKDPEFLNRLLQTRKNKVLNKAKLGLSNLGSKTSVRKFLIEFRGNVCEKCGLSEWLNNKIILEIHHIDGNTKNNSEANLQLLCPNCHSFTDNWRKKKASITQLEEVAALDTA